MSEVRIRQCDPGASYLAQRAEIDAAVARVLASNSYILGAETAAFEAEFAAWLGVPHVVGCASGTDALVLALRAHGVGPGCAVATVSHTAVATVAAIELVGATAVLLDVDLDTFTMDVEELAAVLERPPRGSPPITAVVPVHLYGQAADMAPIRALADRAGAVVIEDCAQSPGASVGGRCTGGWGAAGAFSFYPTKNLGAFGDGGAVSVADTETAERLRALRQYGWTSERISRAPGMNSRLDELQSAILRVKLRRLTQDNARRREIAAAYDSGLATSTVTPAVCRPGREHVYHQYVVRSPDRTELRRRLAAAGVETALHYAVPVHRQSAYEGRTPLGPAQCRNSERLAGEICSLPMHAFLRSDEVERVCDVLRGV